jgi:hypothetical protein
MAKFLTTGIIPVVAILVISLAALASSPSPESKTASQAMLDEPEAIDIASIYSFTVNASAAALVDQ